MPRDTVSHGDGEPFAVGVTAPEPTAPRSVGERLRAAREARGLTLGHVAMTTKVASAYLGAIEAGDFARLPSRVFVLGYVRAYADALELDGDALLTRFREEYPEELADFRAPVGLAYEGRSRLPIYAAGAGALAVSFVLWNVAQRVMVPHERAPPQTAQADLPWTAPAAPTTLVAVGPALPAPAEQTTPPPYETPGMAEWFSAQSASAAAGDGAVVTPALAVPQPAPTAPPPVRAAFNPQGAIYGAAPQRSTVIIQARKPGFVIVRGRDEQIHFARQLAAGDAYRAPPAEGLTVEVSDPAAFDLFRDGELQGPLPGPISSLDKLAAGAPRGR